MVSYSGIEQAEEILAKDERQKTLLPMILKQWKWVRARLDITVLVVTEWKELEVLEVPI